MFGFGSNSSKQRKREEVQRMLLARTNRAVRSPWVRTIGGKGRAPR